MTLSRVRIILGTTRQARSFSATSRSASSIDRRVGTAQQQDQRLRRITGLEALDRTGAPPGMDRHHQVGGPAVVIGGDTHAMAEAAQDARPARGGDAIAGA